MKTMNYLLLIFFLAALSSCWKLDNPMDPEVNEPIAISVPTFSPSEGTYDTDQIVTIDCATSGTIIHFSLDGSEPNSNSPQYENPITISASTTVKAIAIKTGWPDSQISTANYTLQPAAPIFDPAAGTYNNTLNVTIQCATPGTAIHYTTDNTEPTTNSIQYTEPISVTGTTNLKAKAFKTGWLDSQTATVSYSFHAVATPTFNPGGGTYSGNQNVTITCNTEGSSIRYTTNGAEPTSYSSPYSSPISVTGATILKAKAFKTGWPDSQTATASYAFHAVATPTFKPAGGTYSSNQNVSILCNTTGATIRYTTNGSEPTSSSSMYSNPLSVTGTTTLKAKAFKTGWPDSQTATASYALEVATPTFKPAGGTYNSVQNVAISCITPGNTIRYTTDGTEPTTSSIPYSSSIIVQNATTIKAKAFRVGWNDSRTATSSYAFQTDTPFIEPAAGTYLVAQNVAISCTTTGATIRYTIDGSYPSETSTLYTAPIYISDTTTIKAKAYRSGWISSALASANYVVSSLKIVDGGTFNNGTSFVTLSTFYISNLEVTQVDYQAVMEANPSHFNGNPLRPVEQVSWFNAIEYCNRRSLLEGLMPCYTYVSHGTNPSNWPNGWDTDWQNHINISCNWTADGYRLPTEMEWMFAARGGVLNYGYTYSGSNNINNVAWYNLNSSYRTHDTGELWGNQLGTFDMSGNVSEWCWDIYGSYVSVAQTNPTGAISGSNRVYRGGGWNNDSSSNTVSFRGFNVASSCSSVRGFRVVRISPLD